MRRITTKEMPAIKLQLLQDQNNKCGICKKIFTEQIDQCLDHDHTTGFIRGLLCRNCNSMEGKVFNCARRAKRNGTPIEWIKEILNYWIYHSTCKTGLIHPTHKTKDEKRIKRNKKVSKQRKTKTKAKSKS